MIVLFETPAGFGLFKVLKQGKIENLDDVYPLFSDPTKASKIVKLKAFMKFKDSADALKTVVKTVKGKLPSKLKKFIHKNIVSEEIQETLICEDKKLSNSITKKLGIECKSGTFAIELLRGIRLQMANLLEGISEPKMKTMSLGLSHSLSRYKLKFSAEKVDVMIIQAVSLLDDLDKELNNYSMRLKEWYSWHFPELGEIVTDNIQYAKSVCAIGMKKNIKEAGLGEILPAEVVEEVIDAVQISMGSDILEQDELNIKSLAKQVVDLSQYREALFDYLKNRTTAIAPNLTQIVGELVGSRLISRAGSLMNLAKLPSSTVQILGAEKALFKAMRTKHNTPKYGLIYHASLVGQSSSKMKGKVARSLAAKTSLCARYDALGESAEGQFGMDNKIYIETKINQLEGGGNTFKSKKGTTKSLTRTTTASKQQYNPASDFQIKGKRNQQEEGISDSEQEVKEKKGKIEKKEKKIKSATTKKQKEKEEVEVEFE